MKTQIIIISLLLAWTNITVQAGNPSYVLKMTETLETMRAAKSLAEHIKAANTFTMIAGVARDEWLPLYYHANIYINLIYVDTLADNDQKEKYLEIAKVSIDKMLESNPGEAEVQALDGWYWISRIGLRPMVYGMLYIGNYSSAIERSLAIEPENPRAIFLDLSNKIGKAEFFGSDISEYCVDVNALYDRWDSYVPKSELHPTWGKDGLGWQRQKCIKASESN